MMFRFLTIKFINSYVYLTAKVSNCISVCPMITFSVQFHQNWESYVKIEFYQHIFKLHNHSKYCIINIFLLDVNYILSFLTNISLTFW